MAPMADTLTGSSDPAPPIPPEPEGPIAPTQVDLPRAPAPRSKKPRSNRAAFIAAGAGALLVALAVGGMLLYVFFIRYNATARQHLPSNANIAVRVETAKIALFEPVRTRLLSLDTSSADKGSLAERLNEATGLDVRTDVREIVVGSVDGQGWVVLVGGHIPSGIIPKLGAFLESERPGQFLREGQVLRDPSTGAVVTQADDGTLILATGQDLADAAKAPSEDYERLGLGADAAVNFAVSKAAFGGLSSATRSLPVALPFGKILGATGSVDLSGAPKLSLLAKPTSETTSAALAADFTSLLSRVRLLMLLLPDQYGEKGALSSVTVSATDQGVLIEGTWPLDGVERALDAAEASAPAFRQ